MMFHFYCDESYDGKADNPDYFTISGFFSDQPTWSGFHATELNGKKKDYKGWCDDKKCAYSAELLECVNRQKRRMRAYNCSIRGDAYRRIISGAGQIKLGHPWRLCFNSCVAMIAKDMGTLPIEDRFSVVLGRESRFDLLVLQLQISDSLMVL